MPAAGPETITEHSRVVPNIIAVASGKGGVGKTSISVNLGIALAKSGQRVCIFDADTGLANVNILLGMAPQYTLEHVLFGAKTIEEVLESGPFGLKVVPGANGISECVTLHPRQQMRLTRELARIESEFDYLILDTAAGIADNTLDFACAAHQTLVVITPEPTSLTDAFSLIKLLHRRRKLDHFQVVVNMAGSATQAREVFHRFTAAVEKYIGVTPQLLGFLLLDESLRNAVTLQHPVALFPDTDPSSRSFVRLAEAVRQAFEQAGDTPKLSFAEFWQKQFRAQADPLGAAKSARARSAPPEESSELGSYLAELKARLLVLMAKPDVERAALDDLVETVNAAFQRRFHVPAVDPIAAIQAMTERADRNDQQLRELADCLQPWASERIDVSERNDSSERNDVAGGECLAPPTLSEPLAGHLVEVVDAAQPTCIAPATVASNPYCSVESAVQFATAQAAGVVRPLPQSVAPPRSHAYDEHRFGSQSALLDLLRRQADSGKSALELIKILR